jgi:hypothetical protein
MKRNKKTDPYADTPIPVEEYRLFSRQPKSVLRSYGLAKISMAVGLPLFSILNLFHTGIAIALAAVGGITAFFLLRGKYGTKGALAPLLCAFSGIALGVMILTPLVKHLNSISEVVHEL